jgi:hypothetical protein
MIYTKTSDLAGSRTIGTMGAKRARPRTPKAKKELPVVEGKI